VSLDIGVFYTTRPLTNHDASKIYSALCGGGEDPPRIEASPSVAKFLVELRKHYPDIDAASEKEIENCPWACAHDISESAVLCSMVASKYLDAAELVTNLAQKYGLVCYDPQSGHIFTAPTGIHKKQWWWFW
jgi:hypothetical protein